MAKKKTARKKAASAVPMPELALLVTLGSVVMHAKELISPSGHAFDRIELEQILADPDLVEWLEKMDALALIPRLRG